MLQWATHPFLHHLCVNPQHSLFSPTHFTRQPLQHNSSQTSTISLYFIFVLDIFNFLLLHLVPRLPVVICDNAPNIIWSNVIAWPKRPPAGNCFEITLSCLHHLWEKLASNWLPFQEISIIVSFCTLQFYCCFTEDIINFNTVLIVFKFLKLFIL